MFKQPNLEHYKLILGPTSVQCTTQMHDTNEAISPDEK